MIDSDRLKQGRGKYCSRSCLYAYRPKTPLKHGMSTHPLYATWRSMVRRCVNPTHPKYERYGGRGITVDESWLLLADFLEWVHDNLGERPEGCSLDRIDNNGNYEPGNVRWATQSEQCLNSSRWSLDKQNLPSV